jgi:hypothetical protein
MRLFSLLTGLLYIGTSFSKPIEVPYKHNIDDTALSSNTTTELQKRSLLNYYEVGVNAACVRTSTLNCL